MKAILTILKSGWIAAGGLVTSLITGLFPAAASAHELWFATPGQAGLPAKPEIFAGPTALGVYLVTAAAVVFILLIALRGPAERSVWLQKLRRKLVFPYHARQILAAMVGVALMGNALTGSIIAPNFVTPAGWVGTLMTVGSVAIGMGLIFFEYFWFGLCAAFLVLFAAFGVEFGWTAVSHELMYPGIAVFLMMTSPRNIFKKVFSMDVRRKAYAFMRVMAGLNFLALAFVKWLHPELGLKIIAEYGMNFLSSFGMSNEVFLFCVALTETLAAVCLIFNIFTRAFAMVLFPIFTLTVFVLGYKDLLGHLPIKALLATFILYGNTYRPAFKKHSVGMTSQAFEQLPL